MLITIKYFGQIAELTKKNEEVLEVSEGLISGLIEQLEGTYPELKNKDFQVAQNQKLVVFETKLTGDEIALLPPFSGG